METSNTCTCSTGSGVFWEFHFPLPLSFPPPPPPPKQAVSFPHQHSDSSHLILMKPFSPAVNPLFSSFVTLYTLILLYFPSFLLKLLFSPVLISAGILLLCILRFGAAQKGNRNLHETESATDVPVLPKSQTALAKSEDGSGSAHDPNPDPDSSCRGSFMEWDFGAPLEVIHEACCEGEDAPDDAVSPHTSNLGNTEEDRRLGSTLQRYPSLSRYYPATDSDSDSDSDCDSSSSMVGDFPVISGSDSSPEKISFRWAGEEIDDEKDGLIEIQLDGDCGKRKVLEELEFHTEEDNFIEIDISPVVAGKR